MHLHIFKDLESLSEAAADWIVTLIQETLHNKDRFCLLLSGGNTPKELYHLLASEKWKSKIDWSRLHIFFGDERVVPFSDERNNGRMAHDSLLSKVSIPKEQIHYIDTRIDPEVSAKKYAEVLHQYFDGKENSFDLALLGMGDDGHTLSLFPGTDAAQEKKQWVISLYLASQQMDRITLTPAIVNRSTHIAFLVSGSSKASILKKILSPTAAPHLYPAQLINPQNGDLHWFVDEAAGGIKGPIL